MAYESIKCYGWHAEGVEEDCMPDVLVLMSRYDIQEIIRMVQFAAEQSDNFGFVRDSVHMVDALRRVLTEHRERCDEDKDDFD